MSSPTSAGVIDARLIKRFPAAPDSEAFELNAHLRAGAGITALFGASGAGKTLTLDCIAGFTHPDEGRILVNDEIYFDGATGIHVPPERRRCGYIFQDHALFPHMTVRENLRFAASSANGSKNRRLDRHRRINELLETFELAELAARKPAQLSGGQKQRAALARILVSEPRLLLLDEPTRGLDIRLRQAFYEVLQTTRERLQVPILLVTHDMEECFQLADSVCLMEGGRVLQSGERDAVLSRPATVEVARSLGAYNIIPAAISALDPGRNTSRVRVFDDEIEGSYLPGHLIGDQGLLCVRESEIRVQALDLRAGQNQITLRVHKATTSHRGIRIEFEHSIFATVSQADWEQLRSAERLRLEIPPAAVYFIGK
jgi:molybdate transport system ATP-binding protein